MNLTEEYINEMEKKLKLMKDFLDGKTLQFKERYLPEKCWKTLESPLWDFLNYDYRVKPEEQEKPKKLMTNGQLSELLQKGYGTWLFKDNLGYAHAGYSYSFDKEDDSVTDKWIRPWGSKEWIEPTVDIYKEFMNRKEKERRYQNIKISIKKLNGDDFEVESEPDEETIKDYSDAGHREAEPSIGERFLCKGKLYECIECNDCDKCALNETSCYAFNCNERKDGKSVVFVDVSKTENTTASEDSSATVSKEESVGIHKRTPQEIADFFNCYVAMDEDGYWYLYNEEPIIGKDDFSWSTANCGTGDILSISESFLLLNAEEDHNWRTLYRPHREPIMNEEGEDD